MRVRVIVRKAGRWRHTRLDEKRLYLTWHDAGELGRVERRVPAFPIDSARLIDQDAKLVKSSIFQIRLDLSSR